MPVRIKLEVKGLSEVQKALRRLPDAVAKRVVRNIMRRRLKPLAADMRTRVPKLSGDLGRSIRVGSRLSKRQRRIHRKEDRNDIELFAGPGALAHAHMIEFGTSDIQPDPYVRPAWQAGKGRLLPGLARDFWAEIKKQQARLAAKK